MIRLAVERLAKRFGACRALDQIDFTWLGGQSVCVLGLNGAGKSTLLQCLGCLLAPTGGRILIDGETLDRERLDLRRRVGFLNDFPALLDSLKPLEHIAMGLHFYERKVTPEIKAKILDLCTRIASKRFICLQSAKSG
jgi:ABC-type multidrug transport system ATPase subunit